MEGLINGAAPSADDWNDHLIEFHRRFSDVTTGPISQLRTAAGQSSYEFLAGHLHRTVPKAKSIVDLGCGDGTLLRELRRYYPAPVRLRGIDLSVDEIARARAAGIEADFDAGDLRDLDLGEAVYDAAVSHLAVLSISEVARALTRVRSSLRYDGVFVFVVEAQPPPAILGSLITAGVVALRERYAGFVPLVPRGARLNTNEDIETLLRGVGFSGGMVVDAMSVAASLSLEAVWEFTRRLYPFGLLDDTLTELVKRAVENATLPYVVDGHIPVELPVRIVTAYA